MSAPYKVTITVTNSEGKKMTMLEQALDTFFELVEYQKALANGIFAMADDVVTSRMDKDNKAK